MRSKIIFSVPLWYCFHGNVAGWVDLVGPRRGSGRPSSNAFVESVPLPHLIFLSNLRFSGFKEVGGRSGLTMVLCSDLED